MKSLKHSKRGLMIVSFSAAILLAAAGTAEAQNRQQLIKTLLSPLGKNLEKSLSSVPVLSLKEFIGVVSDVHRLKGVIVVDRAAFKARNPDAPDILKTEIRLPRLRNVRLATALQLALDQVVVPAYFRVENKRIVIFPGSPPPLRDQSRTTGIRKNLLKRISTPKALKLKLRHAIRFLTEQGDFTILVSKHFQMENPDRPPLDERTVSIPKVKNVTIWQVITHISKQVEAVPVVQDDHVVLATKAQLRFRGGKRPVVPVGGL